MARRRIKIVSKMRWIVLDIETAAARIGDDKIARYLASRRSELLLEVHPLFSKIIHIGLMWEEGTEHFSGDDERLNLTIYGIFSKKTSLQTVCNATGMVITKALEPPSSS